uniref:Peptidase n=1 Tax=Solibacter usitatus (strain Ellin6076) TaxID=234267 RepID=Q02AR2_SOLUE
MFARHLAAFCLLFAGMFPALAQDSGSQDPQLVVYLSAGTGQSAAPLKSMRQELASLMQQAGYSLVVRDLNDRDNSEAEFLTVVHLNGTCSMPAGYASPNDATPLDKSLATTAITDGRVLPFSTVNCAALTRALQPALLNEPGAQRDFLYGRALARVIAHELYHALSRTTCHAHAGIAKSAFSRDDLLGEGPTSGDGRPASTPIY